LAPDQVIAACEGSLKNLGSDCIDLYQIHWPAGSFGSPKVPLADTMGALDDLKTQGKIRAIGVSNFNRDQIAEAAQYGQIDSVQPPYSLFWRQAETEILPYCRQQGITVLAYSPLAQGLLTGKFGPDHKFERGDHRGQHRLMEKDHYQRVQNALDQLKPMAEKRGISLAQLALAWVIAGPDTCAIAGARDSAQIRATAAAGEITLSNTELSALDTIGRQVTDHLDDNPVQWAWGRR
jgi:aryl-alcohol dehydrogenase-like predicted oxidoreductase